MSETRTIHLDLDAQFAQDLASLLEERLGYSDLEEIECADPSVNAEDELERLVAALRGQ